MHPTQIKTNCNRVQFKMKIIFKKEILFLFPLFDGSNSE